MLSDDDLNLRDLSDEELARAWDLWFDLAQATNDWDPPYSHGVFAGMESGPASDPTNGQGPSRHDHTRTRRTSP